MMVMGLQLSPTCPVIGPRTMPNNPASRPTTGLLACWTLLQHWIGPVLHCPPGEGSVGAAVATAARARTAVEILSCMFERLGVGY